MATNNQPLALLDLPVQIRTIIYHESLGRIPGQPNDTLLLLARPHRQFIASGFGASLCRPIRDEACRWLYSTHWLVYHVVGTSGNGTSALLREALRWLAAFVSWARHVDVGWLSANKGLQIRIAVPLGDYADVLRQWVRDRLAAAGIVFPPGWLTFKRWNGRQWVDL